MKGRQMYSIFGLISNYKPYYTFIFINKNERIMIKYNIDNN